MLRKLIDRWKRRPVHVVRKASTPDEIAKFLADSSDCVSEPALAFDDQGFAHPPWKAVPGIPRYSIGWRMGGGEDYWVAFLNWYGDLENEAREKYRRAYPEPDGWLGFYDDVR